MRSLSRLDDGDTQDCLSDASSGEGPSGWPRHVRGLRNLIATPLNLLLVFWPLGIASGMLQWGSVCTFWLNFIALVPLAGLLGVATEAVALHTGELIGGLVNATFGNAVEVIVTWSALRKNLVPVVQGSLLGSVISNLLLVLGTAFLLGGFKYSEQGFNLKGATSNVSCLLLSSISLVLPPLFRASGGSREDVLHVSRIAAILLTFMYLLFLVFQLKTHVHMFVGDEDPEEEPELNCFMSFALLVVVLAASIASSEFLVGEIEEYSLHSGIPQTFIGVIILPFVGNAVEHTTAVTAAMKNKMDLAIGIAVGSSTQVALFVVPFAVLLGWSMDVDMSLDFKMFDAGVMVLSVLIVAAVVADGYSNWLEGAMLLATYFLCATMFYKLPGPDAGAEEL
mmetsp:Transcript_43531/g.123185  ORF Transcript_43531/g.123185 Transcript_43531/m.123185 type:complete len:395 (-) Transcript_43531:263-1447(-)